MMHPRRYYSHIQAPVAAAADLVSIQSCRCARRAHLLAACTYIVQLHSQQLRSRKAVQALVIRFQCCHCPRTLEGYISLQSQLLAVGVQLPAASTTHRAAQTLVCCGTLWACLVDELEQMPGLQPLEKDTYALDNRYGGCFTLDRYACSPGLEHRIRHDAQ
eukprot:6213031-Pleurochrysis_carterae.AAC.1